LELSFIWLSLWVVLILLDTNRAPFDLLEGERELIRGFNLEIRRLLFIYIFLREYGIIIISSLIGRWGITSSITLFAPYLIILFLFVRRCYPRLRYDNIRGFLWQRILRVRLLVWIIKIFISS
jgi:NADH:ubiquinone oxidoreductase subunit H